MLELICDGDLEKRAMHELIIRVETGIYRVPFSDYSSASRRLKTILNSRTYLGKKVLDCYLKKGW